MFISIIKMENQLDLIQWFKRMGYDNQIPGSLIHICNKSTSFIWNELTQNVKPKQEVDNLRNNVIISRLKSKPLHKQNEFSYPVKNIVLYLKKETLEKKLNNLRSVIKEKKHVITDQSKNNRMKYIAIDKLKSQIKQNVERKYLLEKKVQMLEENIQDAEETLNFVKSLTPVELDENPNNTEITDTLKKCAERLEQLLKDIPMLRNSSSHSTQKSLRFYSAQKELRKQSTFEKYLAMSERKHSEKITILKHGGTLSTNNSNKENIDTERKINKNLFTDITEQNKKAANKRDSLGILPDSYLNVNEKNFLTEIDSVNEIFKSDFYNINEFNLHNSASKHNRDLNCSLQKNQYHHNTKSLNQVCNGFSLYNLYKDEFVTKNLKSLIHRHNRQIIWNTSQVLNDNIIIDVTKNIITEHRRGEKTDINQEDIAKLQFLHIQIELQILKLKAVLRDMLSKVMKKKKLIYATVNSKGLSVEQIEDIGKLFELQLHDICVDVALSEMKKEINSFKKNESNNDLQVIQRKIMQTKEDIIERIDFIKQYIDNIYDTLESTVHIRETTVACVRKLGPFVEDLTWSVPLTESLYADEIKMFEKFPLEYNRRCIYSDSRTYYRDIANDITGQCDFDMNTLYMLTNILESPFSPPEMVVLHILKCKMKLNCLKSLPNHSKCGHKKYCLKELQAQESYLQYALEKLNSIMFSTSANNTLNTVEHMKNVIEIWLEMPLKDFISDKRTVEGHDYKFYEKQYDSFRFS